MKGTHENGIASPKDFATARATGREIRTVTLPKSGLKVRLARPSPMWFFTHGLLPSTIASRIAGDGEGSPTTEDVQALADWMVPLLRETFVQPSLSATPADGEISPDLLDMEDAGFVIRWALGEVGGEGSEADLSGFQADAPAAAGADGGGVRRAAERPARRR